MQHDANFEIEEAIIAWLEAPSPNPATDVDLENDEERADLAEMIAQRLRSKGIIK